MSADGDNMNPAAFRAFAIPAAFVAGLMGLQPASANEGQLRTDEIRALVTGKRIYLATPLGGEIPLYYRPDGQVDGSGEAVGLGRWLKPKDSGRWWVEQNKLCQQWQTWYDGERMCFTLSRAGENRVSWRRENGESGVARLGR